MARRTFTPLMLLAAVLAGGCQDSLPTGPSAFDVQIFVAPTPLTATRSTGVTYFIVVDDEVVEREYQWTSSFAVVVRLARVEQTVGITAVDFRVQQASGGEVVPSDPEDPERFTFNTRVLNEVIGPGGEAVVETDLWYALPNQGKEAFVTVNVSFITSDGVPVNREAEVRVEP